MNIIVVVLLLLMTCLAGVFIGLYVNCKNKKLNESDCYESINEALIVNEELADVISLSKRNISKEYNIPNYTFSATYKSKWAVETPLTKEDLTDSTYNNNKSKFLLSLNDIAYVLAENHDYDASKDALLRTWVETQLPVGFICKKLLIYTSNNLDFFNWFQDYAGFIVEQTIGSDKYNFIVLRGTISKTDWYEDIKVAFTSAPYLGTNVKIHTGFNNLYYKYVDTKTTVPTIRNQITSYITGMNKTNPRLFITGHSLGAAVAAICVLDLFKNQAGLLTTNLDFFGLATPYITNQTGANIITQKPNRIYLINNMNDIVCSKGFIFYVRMPAMMCCFNGPTGAAASHLLNTSYRPAIENNGASWQTNARANKLPLGVLCS
jgi:hypothetical protein